MIDDWDSLRRQESAKTYWPELQQFLEAERSNYDVYPPADEVYAALDLTALAKVRVVILGQDPYHGPEQAHGLAFSVRAGVKPPPSLQNIFKELEADVGAPAPHHGCLEHWAGQGVLLLNTTLTVRAGKAKSHARQGWETFTDEILRAISAKKEPTVFMLWGNPSRRKKSLIADHHHVIESPHPSPLSAYRGFYGSRPFSRANAFLEKHDQKPINWKIPEV